MRVLRWQLGAWLAHLRPKEAPLWGVAAKNISAKDANVYYLGGWLAFLSRVRAPHVLLPAGRACAGSIMLKRNTRAAPRIDCPPARPFLCLCLCLCFFLPLVCVCAVCVAAAAGRPVLRAQC